MTATREVYILKLRFPNLSKDNVLKAARTLCNRPVTLNGRKLEHPSNRVDFAEYDMKTDEIQVILVSVDEEIHEIFERSKQVYATASISKNPPIVLPHLLNFDELVLSAKPIEFGNKTSLNRVPDLYTAVRMLLS